MRYNRALGADIVLGYVTSGGSRFLNDASRAVVLEALSHMSPTMATQMPAVDAYGARIIISPGLIPIPGVPPADQMMQAAAQAGQTVLVSENFAEDNEQVIRLVTNPALLPALTDPALGGTMAVLLLPAGTPLIAPSIPGLPPLSTPSPATPAVPTAPPGAQVAPPAAAPPVAHATIFGMQRSTAIAVGAAAAIGLVAVIALSSSSKGGR
jgi:hypothetical protein